MIPKLKVPTVEPRRVTRWFAGGKSYHSLHVFAQAMAKRELNDHLATVANDAEKQAFPWHEFDEEFPNSNQGDSIQNTRLGAVYEELRRLFPWEYRHRDEGSRAFDNDKRREWLRVRAEEIKEEVRAR